MKSWHRHIVPAGYVNANLVLNGTSPLLMKSGEFDPESELYRSFQILGSQRKKSLDEQARLREMEWKLGLYLDTEIGPYIPAKNVKEMLRSAATKWKRGEDVKRSLIVVEERVPLLYEGPRDQQGLWNAGYRYTVQVANAGMNAGRVMRCRPMFKDWKLEAEIAFDPEDLDFDFLQMVVERAQKYGLGDYRPTFGSFQSSLELIAVNKDASNGDANKPINEHQSKGHVAFVERIKQTA